MKTYQPTGDNIVVTKHDEAETMSSTGLIVVTGVDTKPEVMTGTVTAIGPKVAGIEIGDTIIAPFFAGSEVEDNVIILPAEVVLGVLA